jgi:hypothetical protein
LIRNLEEIKGSAMHLSRGRTGASDSDNRFKAVKLEKHE